MKKEASNIDAVLIKLDGVSALFEQMFAENNEQHKNIIKRLDMMDSRHEETKNMYDARINVLEKWRTGFFAVLSAFTVVSGIFYGYATMVMEKEVSTQIEEKFQEELRIGHLAMREKILAILEEYDRLKARD